MSWRARPSCARCGRRTYAVAKAAVRTPACGREPERTARRSPQPAQHPPSRPERTAAAPPVTGTGLSSPPVHAAKRAQLAPIRSSSPNAPAPTRPRSAATKPNPAGPPSTFAVHLRSRSRFLRRSLDQLTLLRADQPLPAARVAGVMLHPALQTRIADPQVPHDLGHRLTGRAQIQRSTPELRRQGSPSRRSG
jgi:ribosomal protein L37E